MLRAISLYTGVGGLDFGVEAAGFRTAVALEFDRVACATVRLNRPKWSLIEADVHDVESRELLRVGGLKPGQADLLIGGPPCQPFSKSGYWATGDARRLDDPRADTLTAYLRILRDTQPRTFLLENVHGLAYGKKAEGLKYLLHGIEQINRETGANYSHEWKVLNAADYGVPQTRERFFLIGSRDGKRFRFPDATHSDVEAQLPLDESIGSYRTAWDAIGDLPRSPNEEGLAVNGKWGDLLPSIPEGQNYLWHTNRRGGMPLFGWRTRYWSFLLKLAKNRPSWTLQAQPGPYIGPFHWSNRRLSAAEMCRLQTFPDGLGFDCSRNQTQKMLGNAVPSLLAEVLGCEIRKQLLGSRRRRKDHSLLPPVRSPAGRAEPVRRVPERFLSLVGEHDDHPGTGKGRRSRARAS